MTVRKLYTKDKQTTTNTPPWTRL